MKLTSDRLLIGGMLLVLVAIISIIFISYYQTRRLKSISELDAHTHRVLYHTAKVLALAEESAVAARGYSITGNEQFLQPLHHADGSVYKELEQLQNLLVLDVNKTRFDSLNLYIKKSLEFSHSKVQARTRQGAGAAADMVASGMGDFYLGRIRQLSSQIESEVGTRLISQKLESDRISSSFNNALLVVLLAILAALALIIQAERIQLMARKKADKELYYRATLIGNISDAIVSTDENYLVQTWNKPAEDLYGWKEEEVRGKALTKVLGTGLLADHYSTSKDSNQTVWKAEQLHRHKDGRELNVDVSFSVLYDTEGKQTGTISVIRDISNRVKLENELKQLNEHLHKQVEQKTAELTQVFERVTDAFAALDLNWRYTYVNKRTADLYGVKPEELIGETVDQRFPDEDFSWIYEKFELAKKTQQFLNFQRYVPIFGAWFDFHLYPSKEGISGFATDISENMRMMDELKKEREYSDSIINSLPGVFYVIDQEGRKIRWNKNLETLTGYTPDDIIKMKAVDFFPPGERQYINDKIQKVFREGAADAQAHYTSKDGGSILFYFAARRIIIDGVPFVIGTGIDVSEREKAQKERNRLASILEATPDFVAIFNEQKEFLYLNRSARKAMNLDDQTRLPPLSIENYLSGSSNRIIDEEAIPTAMKKGIWRGEIAWKGEGGIEIPISQVLLVHKDETGAVQYISTISRDISEQKRTEMELKDLNLQLRKLSARLEKVREDERKSVAKEIQDELGQQLSGLKMDVSWLHGLKTMTEEEQVKRVNAISKLLEQSINTVRRISTELRPSLLDDLGLCESIQWHNREFSKHSGIKVRFDSNMEDVELPSQTAITLFRIYHEALANIAKHANAKTVNCSLNEDGEKIVLEITDDGRGFDKNNMLSQDGVGLLAMKERALMIGGSFEIHSELGEGATLTVTVPAAKNTDESRLP